MKLEYEFYDFIKERFHKLKRSLDIQWIWPLSLGKRNARYTDLFWYIFFWEKMGEIVMLSVDWAILGGWQ
jgi:hypothetical protein